MSHDFHLNGLSPDEKVLELHTHSNMSDGLDPPEKLIQRAKSAGIRVISLTDHDTVAGLTRASAEAKKLGMEFIPGIEFTCDHDGRSVHLLGHFIQPDAPRLVAQIKTHESARVERMGEIIDRLQDCGLEIDGKDFFTSYANSPSITRGQLGAYMLKKGFARSREQVFEKYIGESAPAYVNLDILSPFDALELIHDAGGVGTLAHPKLSGCDDLIPAMAQAGLAGIEVEHPSQDEDAKRHYRKMAEEHDLLCLGGSDCHGIPHKRDRLGQFSQPLRLLLELSNRAKTRRAAT